MVNGIRVRGGDFLATFPPWSLSRDQLGTKCLHQVEALLSVEGAELVGNVRSRTMRRWIACAAVFDEMAMVELMRERREDGWSLAMIADAFNGDNVRGKNGGKWYGRTVKNILENSVYENVGSGGA